MLSWTVSERWEKISTVTIQIELKVRSHAKKFIFSHIWTAPLTSLKLADGPLALLNVEYLSIVGELAVEDLLIGLQILRHLGFDTRTIEDRKDLLSSTYSANFKANSLHGKGGSVGRLMIARLGLVSNEAVIDKEDNTDVKMLDGAQPFGRRETAIHYYNVGKEEGLFPEAPTNDPLEVHQKDYIDAGITKMLDDGSDNGLMPELKDLLRRLVTNNVDVFHRSFSSGPPAKVDPLRIDLMPSAKLTLTRVLTTCKSSESF